MKQLLVIGLMFFFLFPACTNQYKVPSGIIPKEKMEKILWDMIVADRYVTSFLSKDTTLNLQEQALSMYEQVFTLNKITKDEFAKSMKFYLERPDISKVMLDSLSAKANRLREEMYKTGAPL
jgi:hypothetical protein